MNRPGPAPERGGTPSALDAVRKRSGLTKARNTSVIADMTRMEDEPTADPQPATLHSVPTSAADPAQAPTAAGGAPAQAPTEAVPVQYAPIVQAPVVQQAAPQQAPTQQPHPVTYMQPVQPVQQNQALLRQPAPEPPEPEKKKYRKTSFFQSKESGARMRSAYMATRHLTGSRTLSDFILAAVEREVEALERQYNEGNLFTADPAVFPEADPWRPRPTGRSRGAISSPCSYGPRCPDPHARGSRIPAASGLLGCRGQQGTLGPSMGERSARSGASAGVKGDCGRQHGFRPSPAATVVTHFRWAICSESTPPETRPSGSVPERCGAAGAGRSGLHSAEAGGSQIR